MPTDRFPFVTLALILVNVVGYVLAVHHGGSLISGPDVHEIVKYGAIPYALTHPGEHCGLATVQGLVTTQTIACQGQTGVTGAPTGVLPTWETIFTGMFMHASILHIGGNMLFLWIFGNNVEVAMTAVWRFAPVSIIIVWPAAKSATLATLILVAPAAEAADRVVAGCNRKSVQLLSVSRPSGKRPALLSGALAAGAAGPPKPPRPEPGVGTRQPLSPDPDVAW